MSQYFAYCVKCLRQPKTGREADSQFYDFRFDEPTCLNCVEEYGLEPDEDTEWGNDD
jgi:hypothetical protein